MINLQDIRDGAQLLDAPNDVEVVQAVLTLLDEWHRRQYGYPAARHNQISTTGCWVRHAYGCRVCQFTGKI